MASATILITKDASKRPPTRHKIEPGVSKTQCGKWVNILNSSTDSGNAKAQAVQCQRCFTNGR